jgi:hypothetical protein
MRKTLLLFPLCAFMVWYSGIFCSTGPCLFVTVIKEWNILVLVLIIEVKEYN